MEEEWLSIFKGNIEEAFETLYDKNQPRAADGKWTKVGSGGSGKKADFSTISQELFKSETASSTEALRDETAKSLAASWKVSEEDFDSFLKEDTFSFEEDATLDYKKESVAHHFLRKWAGSSGSPENFHMLIHLNERLGLTVSESGIPEDIKRTQAYIKARPGVSRALTSLADAMYDNTQVWLKERGIKKVKLWRVGAEGKGRPFTSWSSMMAGARYESGRELIDKVVDARRIASVPSTGFGTLAETEVVVLSGK